MTIRINRRNTRRRGGDLMKRVHKEDLDFYKGNLYPYVAQGKSFSRRNFQRDVLKTR